MSALSVTIDYRQIGAAAGGFRMAATLVKDRVLLDAGAKVLVTSIAAEAPVKTGRLRASITDRDLGAGKGIYSVYYGPYVAEGTRPHVIRPRQARVLVFQVGGKMVLARRVNHPGTKPNDFVRRGVERATPALRVLMLENGRRFVNIMENR